MTIEAILAHSAARKRLRIGLCEARVANRYLLWACFGVLQTLACVVVMIWEFDFAASAMVSAVMDILLSITEIASIGAVWLAFFSPSFYRKWIDRSAASA
jgi:preprotein translocase subunit SecF